MNEQGGRESSYAIAMKSATFRIYYALEPIKFAQIVKNWRPYLYIYTQEHFKYVQSKFTL